MCSPDLLPAGSGSWPEPYSAPILNASCLSQQDVFKHEIAFATDKWLTANTAGHFLEDGLRSCLDFDNVIKPFAIRARKGIEGRRSAASHVTPHKIQFFLIEFYAGTRQVRNRHVIVVVCGQTILAPF